MIHFDFQMEVLKDALPLLEELHLEANKLREITVSIYNTARML